MKPPPEGTVERWAWDYVVSCDAAHKLAPPPPPGRWADDGVARRLEHPGRPSGLALLEHSPKTPSAAALRSPARRAQLAHTFLHHELQAAELMAWALLAFPETPVAFRRGLLGVLQDELRHMSQYRAYLRALGHDFGDFPVRDWFWERVPTAPSAVHFVAVLGVGFEGGNLDHTVRFAERLRAAGDEDGARLQERIGTEEIAHVRFALRWFARWRGSADFAGWTAHLPEPLSPMVMRGRPLNLAARLAAGFSPSFLEALGAWSPDEHRT